MFILLGHACVPFTSMHADILHNMMGAHHHTSDDAHDEEHFACCDQVPAESRGSFQRPIFAPVCTIAAALLDTASPIDAALPIWTAAVDFSHPPVFLLYTILLI
jgi:hypothetical protein